MSDDEVDPELLELLRQTLGIGKQKTDEISPDTGESMLFVIDEKCSPTPSHRRVERCRTCLQQRYRCLDRYVGNEGRCSINTQVNAGTNVLDGSLEPTRTASDTGGRIFRH